MKALLFVLLSISAMSLLSGEASANTFFVSTNGNDANAGSSSLPWRTLQHAVDTIGPGDTIIVQPGTYAGCRITRSGSSVASCTLKAATAGTVLINSLSSANRHQSLIEVENFGGTTRYWIIDGFEVAGAQRYGIDLRDTDFITVQNCIARNSTVTGIFLAFCYHPVIQNNESFSNGEHGIYQSNSGDFPIIRGNKLHHNAAAGLHMNGDRNFTPGDGIVSSALVEKNIIWENGLRGGSGINCDGVSDSIIRNNLLYSNHASGVSLYAIDGAEGSSRNKIYNNTIVMASDGRWCVNIPPSAEGQSNPTANKIKNNILYTPHTFRGSISTYSGSVSGFESDYNIVVGRFSIDDGNTNRSLSQWQALGYDSHSTTASPDQLFSNPSANAYTLRAGSPAIDTGTALAEVTDDLSGLGRPQGPRHDIGSYELAAAVQFPVADFTSTPLSGTAPLLVQFTDTSTGPPTSWAWDFGDGATSSERNPSHTYQNPGAFSVALTVSNSVGQSIKTVSAYVTAPAARDFLCTSLTVEGGSVRAGDDASVRSSDNSYLVLKSSLVDGNMGDIVTYVFETGFGSLSQLAVSSESRASVLPQRQRIMLFNVSTGSWDLVDDRSLATTGDVRTDAQVSNPSRYVSASGRVLVRIRTGDLTTARWKHSIDFIKIAAAP